MRNVIYRTLSIRVAQACGIGLVDGSTVAVTAARGRVRDAWVMTDFWVFWFSRACVRDRYSRPTQRTAYRVLTAVGLGLSWVAGWAVRVPARRPGFEAAV
jgi:hypothetical protein